MKTGYGLNTADSLGYLGYGSKPYSSLNYLGSKGYSSSSAGGLRTKSALDKDTIIKTSTDKVDLPLYKKKTFDFTDYAYREAVNRLKFLLTEAYEPTKAATSFYYRAVDDGKSEASDNQSVVERPSLTEVSKYFPSTAVSRYSGSGGLGRRYSFLHRDAMAAGTSSGALKPATSNTSLHPTPSVIASQSLEVAQPPPELLGFIEKQESYIEQLERESQYCREELSTLLKKVKDVVSENEALTDRTRGKGLYQLESSESEDVDYGDRVGRDGKLSKCLSGPNIVFESRISELEAQLAQSQIDLKKLFNENEENKRKLLHGASDVGNADAYRKQVENLQRDKQNLEETVRKLQLSIDQLKDSEACNFNKSQRSRDMIEQVAFERNQAEIEIRRLKDELERQHERVREVQQEMAKRLAEERANAERRYTYHVDQLGGDLSSQWEHATKLQLEVERMKRIESDYKRELNQKNSQIDELKMELKNKSAIFMSDLNQASAEKQSLEQEITSLRLQLERAERQAKVEVSRLNAEITSLRQRLDRADADVLHSKRENLKLADEVASLEKELTLGELNRETRPSKELAKIISDMEAKHNASEGNGSASRVLTPSTNITTHTANTQASASPQQRNRKLVEEPPTHGHTGQEEDAPRGTAAEVNSHQTSTRPCSRPFVKVTDGKGNTWSEGAVGCGQTSHPIKIDVNVRFGRRPTGNGSLVADQRDETS
ncbi:mrp4 [Anopheles sinensis]|uniref:Mrp4 n=1 Tax=Anopheles sinensis TaxID=74873 RepID=A0A084WNK5_ANOSI|nr:mrp4 [Anopheles sinensis]